MTARKASFRGRRRTAGATEIPKSIAAWFAGERRISFLAASPPHRFHLRVYWEAWQAAHPTATPPDGFEVMAASGERDARRLQSSAEPVRGYDR